MDFIKALWFAIIFLAISLFSQASARESIQGCFVRTYDKSHLAKYPNQLATGVRLLIKEADKQSIYRRDFLLEMQFRGKERALTAQGACKESGSRFRCFVECDGGGIELAPSPTHVMMYLERIRMAACAGDNVDISKSVEVSGGIDDREFRVNRVEDSLCSNMHSD